MGDVMIRRALLCLAVTAGAAALLPSGGALEAQGPASFGNRAEALEALDTAREQALRARKRGEAFERQAQRSSGASDRARAQAAALAARIQQAEAAIGMVEAQLALIDGQRKTLDRRLAEKRGPIVRLTGALQLMVRRPLAFSLFKPGSLRDTVYLSAVLDSAIPLVAERTSDLRRDIGQARALERDAREALATRRANERALASRRNDLVALAERERIVARRAAGAADREQSRAIALGEEARNIDVLVARLEREVDLRQQLAALPGPILRPADPGSARTVERAAPEPESTEPPALYQLPVNGRIVNGFAERRSSGARQAGLTLRPRGGAQVVSPGAGRIAFAGPYRGYGDIVIIEHANGWTSLVTGLATLGTRVGQDVLSGSPLGTAAKDAPAVTLELRHEGKPVNPLGYIH